MCSKNAFRLRYYYRVDDISALTVNIYNPIVLQPTWSAYLPGLLTYRKYFVCLLDKGSKRVVSFYGAR